MREPNNSLALLIGPWGDVRFMGPFLHQRKLFITIFVVSLVTASACGTSSSVPTAASGQPPEAGNSPTTGYALPGRSHPPVTVTWVSSLSPNAPGGGTGSAPPGSEGSPPGSEGSPPSSEGSPSSAEVAAVLSMMGEGDSDWYTALAYRHCDSVIAPPDASASLDTLVRGVQAACNAAIGASSSRTEDWSVATQAYAELAGMQMPCQEGAALDLLGRLVQTHQKDPEAPISINLPPPEQQSEC
jgi:hypothetical protein